MFNFDSRNNIETVWDVPSLLDKFIIRRYCLWILKIKRFH